MWPGVTQLAPGCLASPEIRQYWAKTRDKKGRKTDMQSDWTTPAAKAIPKEGYFQAEQGRYGPVFPKTPACYGFTIIAKIKQIGRAHV